VADLLDLIRTPGRSLEAAFRDLSRLPEVPAAPLCLIHADPVATNVITGRETQEPILIDWQCPALGDPCDDLAIVLSPSMQHAYGAPLTKGQSADFLTGYPRTETADRYTGLAPFYALRFAAYARWCHENDRGSGGEEHELAAMEQALSQAAG
jgi:aminoglycoside phosphotransferase (APT) family kinase protein